MIWGIGRYYESKANHDFLEWASTVPKITWESIPATVTTVTTVEPGRIWQITLKLEDSQSRHILTERDGWITGDRVTYGYAIVHYGPHGPRTMQHFIGEKVAK
ncbi:MAG: hypothetical protein WCT02_00395 [Candidatus Paceibacterota bacterium]